MKLDSMDALFLHELGDIYSAEKQITKALPKMAAGASSPALQKALEKHLDVTKMHVERLEQIFESLETKAPRMKCKGMEGLLKEGEELMEDTEDPGVLDAGLVAAAQKVEHYEIAGYGTLITYANLLGLTEAAGILKKTIAEEKEADETLSRLAESSINEKAAQSARRES